MAPRPDGERSADDATAAPPRSTADVADSLQSDWWQAGVVYQIYPRSFADANGDGVGDLAGITDHLDHLAGTPGSLGVDAIWLSPIYPSPDFDFGYDVADYTGVDPKFGTLGDFERLVEAAHARGLRVILDLVLNHTSHRSAWFEASRAGREGQFADWYIWRDSPGRDLLGRRRPPNNWRSFFGGSAWQWDEGRGQFYLHTFLPEQPDLNWRNPAVRAAILDVVRTWLDRGVDGFRLDVFNTFFKDAALRSNPRRIGRRGAWSWQRHIYDRNQPELGAVLAELRAIVNERPGRMTVGELFDGTLADARTYIEPRHLIFDFMFMFLRWRASDFRKAIDTRAAVFGRDRWPANVFSNHDQPRLVNRFGGLHGTDPPERRARGDAIAKVSAAILLTLRGTPFLYYGEEIGLRNLSIPNAAAFDPPARRASWLFPWWNRDQARGPMPWRPGPGGGFTTGRPWLPVAPDADVRNVEAQGRDPDSVLAFYRRLLALRRSAPALARGDQTLLDVGDADVLAYTRTHGGDAALVVLNFASTASTVTVPDAPEGREWRVGLSSAGRYEGATVVATLRLEPLEAVIALAR